MRKREKINNTSFKNKKLPLTDTPVSVITGNKLGHKKTIIPVTAAVFSFSFGSNFPFQEDLSEAE
jgi:hypothetical protein